jgi:pimeloyl-ACP methyl ester carboxylesterase/DNA-binding CsgD family transcriptional regulator
MTGLEARVSAALVRYGALPEAAVHCRISHETAREAFASARKKAGALRQSDFIAKLARLASETNYAPEDAGRVLVDLFSLSLRQSKLALLLTEGHTRGEAARLAGLTEAIAKKEIAEIFIALGITHTAQIGRIVAEGFAATLLASRGNHELPLASLKAAPLRFVPRHHDQNIALSDYGPRKAAPVFVLHSGTATRHIPRSLVGRLQAAGYRPIAIDRPGFGLSDYGSQAQDPWLAAADDMKHVIDALGLEQASFVTRGGNYAMLEFARRWPHHVGKVVCLNPDVSTEHSHKRDGVIGMIWKATEQFPERTEALSRWIGSQATPARVIQMLKMMIKNSPSDLRAFESATEIADYQRAVTMFATGRMKGTIEEHRAHAQGVHAAPIADASNWTVIMGSQDPMHAAHDMESFWRPRLPGAQFSVVDGGGRFLPISHPDVVMAALGKAP